MAPQTGTFDIAIAGGGPAGSVAAALLARAGFRVALATLPPRGPRHEGMSARVAAILQRHRLPLAGIGPAAQRHVSWGAFQGGRNSEHPADRTQFDAGLLNAARAAGAAVFQQAVASLRPDAGVIRLASGQNLSARLLFEARGRRAPRPCTEQSRAELIGPDTISIAGIVQPQTGDLDTPQITARPGGWTWSTPLGKGQLWLQAVGDAAALDKRTGGKAAVAALWHTVLADTPLPRRPAIHAIAPRLTAPELDPHCPRLGDAAVALDPLSGHGMFWAVSSALMAVPIARALLDGGTGLARDFYRNRVAETFWRQARVGRDFYREADIETPFWQPRAAWPDDLPAHGTGIRPHIARRVIVQNGHLARREVLITRDAPGGAAFAAGQEIVPLLRRLNGRPLPDAARFHTAVLPAAPPQTARAIHQWLLSQGFTEGAQIPWDTSNRENLPWQNEQPV
ncbi:flavin-dependent monooxygenase QhpG [Leisingera methylohalidivorans]|uniref:Pilus assembly protein CpaE n=1 Tax=Leisingera methylohalidivorans DSM 14336 TaxID=999552 RepID=V9VYU5_9RHOB|nr:pilus assembly protein CpaE [Leisingera methylohalidivorans]AHD02082.1 pilus assembly protein CpaE [Leisingera methylohalidivorans DSM 14336]